MEELIKRHRQEQKDLQSRVMQKKKNATKKTRKGINDECAELERQLHEKQESELQSLSKDSEAVERDAETGEDENASVDSKAANDPLTSMNDGVKSFSVSTAIPETNGYAKKPNRQKARLARRAADQEAAIQKAEEEAADLPDLREKEREEMRQAYESKGLVEHEIRSDGHCLYAAVADQLVQSKIDLSDSGSLQIADSDRLRAAKGYQAAREVAATYIQQHPDDFAPFLEEPLESYVRTIRDTGEWGGHLELLALAKAYEVDINVLQASGRVESISEGEKRNDISLWLAYYHHNFGLGEHYNSLRKKDA